MYQRIIDDIEVLFSCDKGETRYAISNSINGAFFTVNTSEYAEEEYTVFYRDPFGNSMVNIRGLKVTINKTEPILLPEYGSFLGFSNNTSITSLSMKDIQEIANKTFYLDNQKNIVDFQKLTIKDGNNIYYFFDI